MEVARDDYASSRSLVAACRIRTMCACKRAHQRGLRPMRAVQCSNLGPARTMFTCRHRRRDRPRTVQTGDYVSPKPRILPRLLLLQILQVDSQSGGMLSSLEYISIKFCRWNLLLLSTQPGVYGNSCSRLLASPCSCYSGSQRPCTVSWSWFV